MLQKIKFILTIAALLCCQGCTSEKRLVVNNLYITPALLASYYVGTPDPRLECPTIGQRLNIRWNVKDIYHCYHEMYVELHVLYHNNQKASFIISICRPYGHSHYYLLNDEYLCTRGIQSYKVEMYGDGELIETWQHQLWTNLIDFSQVDLENRAIDSEAESEIEDLNPPDIDVDDGDIDLE